MPLPTQDELMASRISAALAAERAAFVSRSELDETLNPTVAPSDLNTTADTGTEAVGYARADHSHRHGQQGSGNQHLEATTLTAGFMSAADKAALDALVAAPPAGEAFPVGAVYINVTGVDPATELGYGTWSAFGAGRVMVGYDSGDTDFDTAEETGGAKTVASAGSVAAPTISGSTAAEAAHTHTYTDVVNHTHPVNITDPGHQHGEGYRNTGTAGTAGVQGASTANNANIANGVQSNTTGITATTSNPGSGVATGTTAAGSSHSHGAGTLAASAPAFTGSPTSVVQPYIVVHFWKRTA